MRRVWVGLGIVVLVCLVLVTAAYFGLPQIVKVTVSGRVEGASVLGHEQGQLVAVPIAATITCNSAVAQTAADGSYNLRVPAALHYVCTASAPPRYLSQSYSFSPLTGLTVILDFAFVSESSCTAAQGAAAIECPVLALRTGTLRGAITYADTGQAASKVTVTCVSADVPATADPRVLEGYSAKTDAQGRYMLPSMPIGRYTCVAGGDYTAHPVSVQTTGDTLESFPICPGSCDAVTPHGGPVIHTMTAYLIFWLPSGQVYDGNSTPATFENLVTGYMRNVGGTAYYSVLGQYWDAQGAIQNSVTLGGTYTDTRSYPQAADQSQPLLDTDIQTEVSDAMRANHWQAGTDQVFFVLTAYGAEFCHDSTAKDCSFPTPGSGDNVVCGYHDNFAGATSQVVYAEIINSEGCNGSLSDQPSAGPNGDRIADLQIQTLAHEQVEAASDPLGNGWYSGAQGLGEVADLCVPQDGVTTATTLNNGQMYLLQATWSDRTNTCEFSG